MIPVDINSGDNRTFFLKMLIPSFDEIQAIQTFSLKITVARSNSTLIHVKTENAFDWAVAFKWIPFNFPQ